MRPSSSLQEWRECTLPVSWRIEKDIVLWVETDALTNSRHLTDVTAGMKLVLPELQKVTQLSKERLLHSNFLGTLNFIE